MFKLDKKISKLNKENDAKRFANETIAERTARQRNNELYSPLSMYVRATTEDKSRQKKLGLGYGEYLKMYDESKIGTCEVENRDDELVVIVHTELGPIIKRTSKGGSEKSFEGYCCSEDFTTNTKHYYYTSIGFKREGDCETGVLKYTGFVRDDNGIFHSIHSTRGKALVSRPYGTIEDRFDEAMRTAVVVKGVDQTIEFEEDYDFML